LASGSALSIMMEGIVQLLLKSKP